MEREGRLDGLTVVGLAFLLFMMLNVLKDRGLLDTGSQRGLRSALAKDQGAGGSAKTEIPSAALDQPLRIELPQPAASEIDQESNAIAPPYAHYFLTLGPHGVDYGHLAIDISAGKSEPILSPINGRVADLKVDEWGNTVLLLENEMYIVELLHGIYSMQVGDPVILGQPVGLESNQGNTVDPAGISCRGRDCGYHTHINIYDKSIGANLNPLDIFPAQK